jgi:hypothetical protein
VLFNFVTQIGTAVEPLKLTLEIWILGKERVDQCFSAYEIRFCLPIHTYIPTISNLKHPSTQKGPICLTFSYIHMYRAYELSSMYLGGAPPYMYVHTYVVSE